MQCTRWPQISQMNNSPSEILKLPKSALQNYQRKTPSSCTRNTHSLWLIMQEEKNCKLRYLSVWNAKQTFHLVFRCEEYRRVEALIKQVQRCQPLAWRFEIRRFVQRGQTVHTDGVARVACAWASGDSPFRDLRLKTCILANCYTLF